MHNCTCVCYARLLIVSKRVEWRSALCATGNIRWWNGKTWRMKGEELIFTFSHLLSTQLQHTIVCGRAFEILTTNLGFYWRQLLQETLGPILTANHELAFFFFKKRAILKRILARSMCGCVFFRPNQDIFEGLSFSILCNDI